MERISDFVWNRNKNTFSWTYNKTKYEKIFSNIPYSIIELSDKTGFAVVCSIEEFGMNNAFIINADRSIRYSLSIPNSVKRPKGFYEIYYIGDLLTAIILTEWGDFACDIDANTGSCSNIHETR